MDWSRPVTSLLELVREAVPDKDKQAQIEYQVRALQVELQKAVLQSDLPWQIRALHLMGRQLLIFSALVVVVSGSLWSGEPLDWQTITALVGAPQLYIALKGQGR